MWEQWKNFKVNHSLIKKRLQKTCSSLSWKYAIDILNKKKKSLEQMNIAEVGCGTGTFSLTLCLLGAKTTLIDSSADALNVAKTMYNMCNKKVTLLKGDVLESPPSDLINSFDLVSSWGLVEHFIGENREKVIAYHTRLLAPGGLCLISSPNRYSPNYRFIRGLKELTGTWNLEVEVPFSNLELRNIAKKVGLSQIRVLGNFPLFSDTISHAKGVVSVLLDILPSSFRKLAHKFRPSFKNNIARDLSFNHTHLVNQHLKVLQNKHLPVKKNMTSDFLCSSITLICVK